MQNSAASPGPVASTSSKRRFRFFSWSMVGRGLIGLAGLITLIALLYAEEDWRGKHAWEKYRREAEARGIGFDWKKLVPPPVPDNQNFAMTPFLAPLLDLNPQPTNGNIYRDTNGLIRAQNFAKVLLSSLDHVTPPENGSWEITDLPALAAAVEKNSRPPHKRPRVPSQEQAAKFLSEDQPKVYSQKEATEFLSNYLKQLDPVLDEIRAASRRPHARFNLDYAAKNPTGILLPHLTIVKRLATVCATKAVAELAQGNSEAAAEEVRLILRLADSVRSEPFIICDLVRMAVVGLAEKTVWEGLAEREWTDAQLQMFATELAKIPLLPEARDALNGERTFFGTRWFDYARNHSTFLHDILNGPNVGDGPGLVFIPTGWIYQEQVNYHRFYEEKISLGMDPAGTQVHPGFIDMTEEEFEHSKHGSWYFLFHHQLFSRLLHPALNKFYQKAALGQTGLDQAILACALERYHMAHGAYPEKLETLVPQWTAKIPSDVCSGQPLKYRFTGTNAFVLYSVGWNEKDDGGTLATKKQRTHPNSDLSQGDWVWPAYPR